MPPEPGAHTLARDSITIGDLPSAIARVLRLGAHPGECVFVGDSATDVTAGHTAGVAVIGYANRPGKDRQLADAVVDSLDELSTTLRSIH